MTEHRTAVAVARYEQLVAAGRPQMLPTGNVREENATFHQHNMVTNLPVYRR